MIFKDPFNPNHDCYECLGKRDGTKNFLLTERTLLQPEPYCFQLKLPDPQYCSFAGCGGSAVCHHEVSHQHECKKISRKGSRLSKARANFFIQQLLCLVAVCSFDCSTLRLMRLETGIRGWHFFFTGINVFIILRDFRNTGFSASH